MAKRKVLFLVVVISLIAAAPRVFAALELVRSYSTSMFTGNKDNPLEIIMFKIINTGPESVNNVEVEVTGALMEKAKTESIKKIEPSDSGYVRVTLPALPRGGSGTADFHLKAKTGGNEYEWNASVERFPPDWRKIHLHTHFHYDPVWIHKDGQRGYALSAISLIKQYIQACKADPTYTFVLEQIPYLKPFWDNYPEDRATLQELMKRKQLEMVGGAYDQPDESSVFGEGLIRNFYYGRFFEQEVMKGKPAAGWQIDNFGHTPQYPQILLKNGMGSFTFLRGGPKGLPRQFMWIGPDGSQIYTADLGIKDELGKVFEGRVKVDKKEDVSMEMIQNLEKEVLPDLVGALKGAHGGHSFFLPLGDDFMPPMPILGTLTRYWNGRYLYPALKFSLPDPYFKETLKEVEERPMDQRYTTKDLNPVFSGCYSSRTDIKIANRQAEMTYLDAEFLATVANLLGASYPARALDKALRELLYNDHHDSIPGTTNELSYLDILYAWRESLALSSDVRDRALGYIAGKADISASGARMPLLVMNTLSFQRTDTVEVVAEFPVVGLQTKDGTPVPFDYYKTGNSYKLRFTAVNIPPMGYRIYYALRGVKSVETVKAAKELQIENEHYKVQVDPKRGGGIIHLIDKKTGVDWAADKAGKLQNTLFVMEDKGDLWDMRLSGGYSTTAAPAKVAVTVGKTFSKIVSVSKHPNFSLSQTVILQKGVPRVDFVTRVYEYKGQDKLFKLVFPVSKHKGLTPVYGERFAPISRKYGEEFPADGWAALTKSLVLRSGDGEVPVGVPAVVVHRNDEAAKIFVKKLIEAMMKAGTPSVTYFEEEQPDLTTDSAIYVGEPDSFKGLSEKMDGKSAAAERAVASTGLAAIIKGDRPILLIGKKVYGNESVFGKIAAGIIGRKTIEIGDESLLSPLPYKKTGSTTFALISNGSNGFRFDGNGTMELQMLRSVTGRPAGEAYSRALAKEDWNHTFNYSITAGDGDWESRRTEAASKTVGRPLLSVWTNAHKGSLPGDGLSFFSVEPEEVLISAVTKADDSIPSYTRNKKYDGTMIRVYSDSAEAATVKLKSYFAVNSAEKTDMQGRGPRPIAADGNVIMTEVGARAIETFVLRLAGSPADGKVIGRDAEAVQPLYSAYWRHGDNVSPLGYQPLTVSFDPQKKEGLEATEVKLKIASDYIDSKAAGTVELTAPDGWSVEPRKIDYSVDADGFKIVPVKVTPGPNAEGGVVRAFYENEGQKFYASFSLGNVPLPKIAGPAEVSVKWGDRKDVVMRLTNDFSQPLSGEAVVVSPIGTWKEFPATLEVGIEPFRAPFEIPANGKTDFQVKLNVKDNALPGSFWFALKLMANGEYVYSKSVEVKILP